MDKYQPKQKVDYNFTSSDDDESPEKSEK